MKILVTGGAGFIGSTVVDAYLAAGHEVAVIDNLSTGHRENLSPQAHLFQGDLGDISFINSSLKDFKPAVINHHAAQISVVASTEDLLHDATNNILNTINLLQAAGTVPSVTKFLYASSGGAMYGNPAILPCTEETPADPQSPYGLSKYTAERYAWLLQKRLAFGLTVLRYGNVYGPRQDPEGEAGVCAIFTNRMLENQPVKIYGDGSQFRDYIFVQDIARANLAALTTGGGQAYNIGTGKQTTTYQVYQALKEVTGYTLEAEMAPERPGEVQGVVLAVSKAEAELGWQASHSFKEGIEVTVAWYKAKKR